MSYFLLPDHPVESPEWFAARAGGVSASDMHLIGRDTIAAFAELKARKLGQSTFHGNAYTAWGKEREPAIAERVEFEFDVHPTDRIAQSDIDPRWLASPDGIGDMLGEYKTTGTDWPLDVQDIPPSYYDQVQWAQFVLGIDQTVFAWEVRLGSAPYFTPGGYRRIIIPHNPKRVAELLDAAERFWVYYQGEQTPGEWDDMLARWADMTRRSAELAAERAELDAEIRERAGADDLAVKSDLGSISLAFPKPRATFDATAFKQDHPDLHSQYMTTTPPAQKTLRVTPKA